MYTHIQGCWSWFLCVNRLDGKLDNAQLFETRCGFSKQTRCPVLSSSNVLASPPCIHDETRILFLPFKYFKSNTYSSAETDGHILHHDQQRLALVCWSWSFCQEGWELFLIKYGDLLFSISWQRHWLQLHNSRRWQRHCERKFFALKCVTLRNLIHPLDQWFSNCVRGLHLVVRQRITWLNIKRNLKIKTWHSIQNIRMDENILSTDDNKMKGHTN